MFHVPYRQFNRMLLYSNLHSNGGKQNFDNVT